MTIDEGGIPTSGLSDYVSGRFSDIARQKAEAERLKTTEAQATSEREVGESWKPMPVFKLDYLIDADNFKRLIPTFKSSLEGSNRYGLSLESSSNAIYE